MSNNDGFEQVKAGVEKNFDEYFTLGELQRSCAKEIKDFMTGSDLSDVQIHLKTKAMIKEGSKNQFNQLRAMYTFFTGIEFEEKRYTELAYIAFEKSRDENVKFAKVESFKTNSKETIGKILDVIGKHVVQNLQKNLYQALRTSFIEKFMKDHIRILPISKKQLKEYCEQNKLDINTYRILPNSNLLYNACLAPACPHYMKIGSMKHHLGTWITKCPAGFHMTVKSNRTKSAEEILEIFIAHQQHGLDYFGLKKDDVLSYINTLK